MDSQINQLIELETKKMEIYDNIYKSYLNETDDTSTKSFIKYCINKKIFLFMIKQFIYKQFNIIINKNNTDFIDFFNCVLYNDQSIGNIMLDAMHTDMQVNYNFKFDLKGKTYEKEKPENLFNNNESFIQFNIPCITYSYHYFEQYVNMYNIHAPTNKCLPNAHNESSDNLKSLMQSDYLNCDILYFIQRFHVIKQKIQYEFECKDKFQDPKFLNVICGDKPTIRLIINHTHKDILLPLLKESMNIVINDNTNENNSNVNNQISNNTENINNNNQTSYNADNINSNNKNIKTSYNAENINNSNQTSYDLCNNNQLSYNPYCINNNQTSSLGKKDINNLENNSTKEGHKRIKCYVLPGK